MDKFSRAARVWTDKELFTMEKEIKTLYSKSYAEIKKKSRHDIRESKNQPGNERNGEIRRVPEIWTVACARNADIRGAPGHERRGRENDKRENGGRLRREL